MGTKDRREREKAAKKSIIIETAKHLFETRGFTEVTMMDIAEACEYSIGLIYIHFKSKDAIYLSLATLGATKIDELLKAGLSGKQSLTDEEAEEIIEGFLAVYADYGSYFDVMRLTTGKNREGEFVEESMMALGPTILSSICALSDFYLAQAPDTEHKEDVAIASTFASWAFLLGIAQLDSKGRSQLMDQFQRKTLIRYAARAFRKQIAVEIYAMAIETKHALKSKVYEITQ